MCEDLLVHEHGDDGSTPSEEGDVTHYWAVRASQKHNVPTASQRARGTKAQ